MHPFFIGALQYNHLKYPVALNSIPSPTTTPKCPKGEDLAKVRGGDDGDDAAEDGVLAALALVEEGKDTVEVLGGLGGDMADRALVELGSVRGRGSGGGEADEGVEHLEEAVHLLPHLQALCLDQVHLLNLQLHSFRHWDREDDSSSMRFS